MIKAIDLAGTAQIANPAIRQLVVERINDLGGEAFDSDAPGLFLVIEPGTPWSPLMRSWFSDPCQPYYWYRFDAPEFWPSFEFVEEFPSCYDMVFIISDDGFGIEVFIPKDIDIPDPFAMCQRYAFKDQS